MGFTYQRILFFFGDFLRILQILHGAQNGAEFWHRAFKEHPAACGLKGPPADRAPRARPYRGSLQVGFMWASPLRPLWMLADVQSEIWQSLLNLTKFDRFYSEVCLVCNETRHFGMVWADLPFKKRSRFEPHSRGFFHKRQPEIWINLASNKYTTKAQSSPMWGLGWRWYPLAQAATRSMKRAATTALVTVTNGIERLWRLPSGELT